MPRVRFKPMVVEIHGTMYDVVFKKSPKGNQIVTKCPDMSNVEWSKAQIAQRQRFKQANQYAKAAMADLDVRAIYEEMAAKEGRGAFATARSDYFKGNNLLLKK